METSIGLVVIIGIAIYFIPTIIAISRGHLSSGAIVAINIFLGWTFLGWLLSLVLSLTGNTRGNETRKIEKMARMINGRDPNYSDAGERMNLRLFFLILIFIFLATVIIIGNQ